jgi:Predicted membrane protein (DUF2207) C-terminal domain/Predicted membrane protein (DUF2207) N-terminal domain
MRKLTIFVLLLLLCNVLLAKSYYAQDFNCQLNVRENGDLHVRETFRYHFSGGEFTWVKRNIPKRATDGLEFIRAFVKDTDGNIISETDNYKFEDNHLIVRWDFEPTNDNSLDFELEFIARHVCYHDGEMLIFDYQPLPRNHDFIIDQGKVEVIMPRGLPKVMGTYSTTSEKVLVSYTDNSVIYIFYNMEGDETFPVVLTMPGDTLPIEKPHWQEIDDKQKYYGKYFLWLAGVLLVIVLSLLMKLVDKAQRYKNHYTPDNLPENLYEIHPGFVSKIINNMDNSSAPFAAIFFRLLKLGFMKIETVKKGKYNVALNDQIPENSIDKNLYEILQNFVEKGTVNIKKIFLNLSKHRKDFNYELAIGLYDAGYVDETQHRRLKKQHFWLTVSLIVLIVAIFAGIIRFSFGYPYILFLSIPLTALFTYIIYKTSTVDVLTDKGYEEKYTWLLWKKTMLHNLKKEPEKVVASEFDVIYPYAMVMGFADRYLKFFKKSGIDLTESKLMQSFDSPEEFSGFMATYAAIFASSGSSGASGGGAGAGGGGASAG